LRLDVTLHLCHLADKASQTPQAPCVVSPTKRGNNTPHESATQSKVPCVHIPSHFLVSCPLGQHKKQKLKSFPFSLPSSVTHGTPGFPGMFSHTEALEQAPEDQIWGTRHKRQQSHSVGIDCVTLKSASKRYPKFIDYEESAEILVGHTKQFKQSISNEHLQTNNGFVFLWLTVCQRHGCH